MDNTQQQDHGPADPASEVDKESEVSTRGNHQLCEDATFLLFTDLAVSP